MRPHELKIRTGSLIIEKSHIFLGDDKKHSIENYGIVLSVHKLLGVEVFWIDQGASIFYPKGTFGWFMDGTVNRFWIIHY